MRRYVGAGLMPGYAVYMDRQKQDIENQKRDETRLYSGIGSVR